MFFVRIFSVDHYMTSPIFGLDPTYSQFRGKEVKQVPVLRIFGANQTGHKTCLHVHGVFPYLHIPHDETSLDATEKLCYRVATSLDKAINILMGQSESTQQHVFDVTPVAGIPVYGYHNRKHQYLKIRFFNPFTVKKAAALFQNGTILERVYQPHDAHINYELQFMIDFNLHGMNNIYLSEIKYRINQNDTSILDDIPSSYILNENITRMSTCKYEIDCLSEHIVNLQEVTPGKLNVNPGIAAIWEEERHRRRLQDKDTQDIAPTESQFRAKLKETTSETFFKNRLKDRFESLKSLQDSNASSLPTPLNQSIYPLEVSEPDQFLNASIAHLLQNPELSLTSSAKNLDESIVNENLILSLTQKSTDKNGPIFNDIYHALVELIDDSIDQDSILSQHPVNEHEVVLEDEIEQESHDLEQTLIEDNEIFLSNEKELDAVTHEVDAINEIFSTKDLIDSQINTSSFKIDDRTLVEPSDNYSDDTLIESEKEYTIFYDNVIEAKKKTDLKSSQVSFSQFSDDFLDSIIADEISKIEDTVSHDDSIIFSSDSEELVFDGKWRKIPQIDGATTNLNKTPHKPRQYRRSRSKRESFCEVLCESTGLMYKIEPIAPNLIKKKYVRKNARRKKVELKNDIRILNVEKKNINVEDLTRNLEYLPVKNMESDISCYKNHSSKLELSMPVIDETTTNILTQDNGQQLNDIIPNLELSNDILRSCSPNDDPDRCIKGLLSEMINAIAPNETYEMFPESSSCNVYHQMCATFSEKSIPINVQCRFLQNARECMYKKILNPQSDIELDYYLQLNRDLVPIALDAYENTSSTLIKSAILEKEKFVQSIIYDNSFQFTDRHIIFYKDGKIIVKDRDSPSIQTLLNNISSCSRFNYKRSKSCCEFYENRNWKNVKFNVRERYPWKSTRESPSRMGKSYSLPPISKGPLFDAKLRKFITNVDKLETKKSKTNQLSSSMSNNYKNEEHVLQLSKTTCLSQSENPKEDLIQNSMETDAKKTLKDELKEQTKPFFDIAFKIIPSNATLNIYPEKSLEKSKCKTKNIDLDPKDFKDLKQNKHELGTEVKPVVCKIPLRLLPRSLFENLNINVSDKKCLEDFEIEADQTKTTFKEVIINGNLETFIENSDIHQISESLNVCTLESESKSENATELSFKLYEKLEETITENVDVHNIHGSKKTRQHTTLKLNEAPKTLNESVLSPSGNAEKNVQNTTFNIKNQSKNSRKPKLNKTKMILNRKRIRQSRRQMSRKPRSDQTNFDSTFRTPNFSETFVNQRKIILCENNLKITLLDIPQSKNDANLKILSDRWQFFDQIYVNSSFDQDILQATKVVIPNIQISDIRNNRMVFSFKVNLNNNVVKEESPQHVLDINIDQQTDKNFLNVLSSLNESSFQNPLAQSSPKTYNNELQMENTKSGECIAAVPNCQKCEYLPTIQASNSNRDQSKKSSRVLQFVKRGRKTSARLNDRTQKTAPKHSHQQIIDTNLPKPVERTLDNRCVEIVNLMDENEKQKMGDEENLQQQAMTQTPSSISANQTYTKELEEKNTKINCDDVNTTFGTLQGNDETQNGYLNSEDANVGSEEYSQDVNKNDECQSKKFSMLLKTVKKRKRRSIFNMRRKPKKPTKCTLNFDNNVLPNIVTPNKVENIYLDDKVHHSQKIMAINSPNALNETYKIGNTLNKTNLVVDTSEKHKKEKINENTIPLKFLQLENIKKLNVKLPLNTLFPINNTPNGLKESQELLSKNTRLKKSDSENIDKSLEDPKDTENFQEEEKEQSIKNSDNVIRKLPTRQAKLTACKNITMSLFNPQNSHAKTPNTKENIGGVTNLSKRLRRSQKFVETDEQVERTDDTSNQNDIITFQNIPGTDGAIEFDGYSTDNSDLIENDDMLFVDGLHDIPTNHRNHIEMRECSVVLSNIDDIIVENMSLINKRKLRSRQNMNVPESEQTMIAGKKQKKETRYAPLGVVLTKSPTSRNLKFNESREKRFKTARKRLKLNFDDQVNTNEKVQDLQEERGKANLNLESSPEKQDAIPQIGTGEFSLQHFERKSFKSSRISKTDLIRKQINLKNNINMKKNVINNACDNSSTCDLVNSNSDKLIKRRSLRSHTLISETTKIIENHSSISKTSTPIASKKKNSLHRTTIDKTFHEENKECAMNLSPKSVKKLSLINLSQIPNSICERNHTPTKSQNCEFDMEHILDETSNDQMISASPDARVTLLISPKKSPRKSQANFNVEQEPRKMQIIDKDYTNAYEYDKKNNFFPQPGCSTVETEHEKLIRHLEGFENVNSSPEFDRTMERLELDQDNMDVTISEPMSDKISECGVESFYDVTFADSTKLEDNFDENTPSTLHCAQNLTEFDHKSQSTEMQLSGLSFTSDSNLTQSKLRVKLDTQNLSTVDFDRKKCLTIDGFVVLMPKFNPPTYEDVESSLLEYGIPEIKYESPFYSVPSDATGRLEIGHKILKVPTKCVQDLPEFASQLEFDSIVVWRKRNMDSIHSSQGKKVHNLQCLSSNREIYITPCNKPPTFKEVETWLKAKDHLQNGKQKCDKPVKIKIKISCSPGNVDHSDDDTLTLTPCTPKIFSNIETPANSSSTVKPNSRRSSLGRSPSIVHKNTKHVLKNKRVKIALAKSFLDNSSKLSPVDSTTLVDDTLLDPSVANLLNHPQFRKDLNSPNSFNNSSSLIKGATPNNTHGFKVPLENFQDVKAMIKHQYLTTIILELHMKTRDEFKPNPQLDPIVALFYSIYNDVLNDYELPPSETGIICVGENNFLAGNCNDNVSVTYVDSELKLFEDLIQLFTKWDPDILAGYEIQRLSWGFLLERGFHLKLNLPRRLSRIPESRSNTRIDENGKMSDIHFTGRIFLEIWRLMRHEIDLYSYSFENVVYHILHERIPKHSFKNLSHWFESTATRYITIQYYLKRATGVLKLLDQLDFIGRTSELARLFGIQFYEVLSRGSQFRVESMMLRLTKPLNYIPVSPSVAQRAKMKAPEFLPLIMEPDSRLYNDPIIVLDFQSLYPSMIIAYNYCFSTCLGRVSELGQLHPFEFGATQLRVNPKLVESFLNNNKLNISPCGVVFVNDSVRQGILPRMLKEILDCRLMVKKSLKENKDDATLKRVLNSRQLGLKLIANVTYGYTAANFSGRMPCCELADSVVSKGRETLERAIQMVEKNEKWKAKVVYGDTDSLFVMTPGRSRKDAFQIGKEIAEAVTNDNPTPVKLKLEKIYQPCILQTKKRYVGYMYESPDQQEPVYNAKGIETVRRDGCPAVAKILEKSLRILFETKDMSLVKQYVCRQFSKIITGRVNMQDLIFAREFRGSNGYRPGAMVPALELAKRYKLQDPRSEPQRSERVPYVIASGAPGTTLVRLAKGPQELLADSALKPHIQYYITKVIIPPLNRCLSLCGVDVHAWYKDLPRKYKLYFPSAESLSKDSKKSTIAQHFATTSCVSCGFQTRDIICPKCLDDTQKTVLVLQDKLREWERNLENIKKICNSCCGRFGQTECVSLDCPVLYRLTQAQRDYEQAPFVRNALHTKIDLDMSESSSLF